MNKLLVKTNRFKNQIQCTREPFKCLTNEETTTEGIIFNLYKQMSDFRSFFPSFSIQPLDPISVRTFCLSSCFTATYESFKHKRLQS